MDGQLVISHDILGTFVGDVSPRFVRPYAKVGADIERAFRAYAEDVRGGGFPGPEQCYELDPKDETEIRGARLRFSRWPR